MLHGISAHHAGTQRIATSCPVSAAAAPSPALPAPSPPPRAAIVVPATAHRQAQLAGPCRPAGAARHRAWQRRQVATQAYATPAYDDEVAIEEMAIAGEYDAAKNASVWGVRPVPVISRLIKIGVELASWQIMHPDDGSEATAQSARATNMGGWGRSSARQNQRAAAMRELLVRLGPAFVKIGQALSSRPDILPPNYLVELEALQDRIPAFDSQEAFQVIEEELGAPLSTVFSQISAEPVAAASLGQVYKAVTRNGGQEVAVKVQRPGVADAIALDVYILRWLAAAFRKLRNLNTDLPALVDEWATSLFRELDYRREARNAERFKALYSELEGVYVPAVYKELTTAKVLTMEWVDGERLRTVADNLSAPQAGGAVRASSSSASSSAWGPGMANRGWSQEPRARSEADLALVEVGVRCSLEQMLEQGFYHADPHPGNLLRTRDGRLAYLDFGMCGELDQKTRQALIRATLHLVNREYNQLAQDFIDLGLLPPGSDKQRIVPALTGVFQQALSRGVSNVSFGDLSGQLGRTMYQFSFRIPPYYTLLVRSLSVLEGIALASDPNYKVLGSAYPWIARRLLTNQTPELQSTLRALLYTPTGFFRFNRLDSLLQEAVRTPRALPPALTVPSSGAGLGGTTPASGRADGGGPLTLLLTPDASFVRNILLDEMAKGIDAGLRVSFDTAVNSALHPLPVASRIPVLGPLLVPLLTPFTTTSRESWGFNASYMQDPKQPHLGGPAGALLAALPQLASQQDKEQLEGIQKMVNALSGLAASTSTTTVLPSTSSGVIITSPGRPAAGLSAGAPAGALAGRSPSPAPRSGTAWGAPYSTHSEPGLIDPAEALHQLQQAVQGLRWLVSEVMALPPPQQAEAMRLPQELAARVGSRVTARALRSLFAGPPQEVEVEVDAQGELGLYTTPLVVEARSSPVPPYTPAAPPAQRGAWGEVMEVSRVDNALAGSSIV